MGAPPDTGSVSDELFLDDEPAQTFAIPDRPPVTAPLDFGGRSGAGYGAHAFNAPARSSGGTERAPAVGTLEDLYDAFPELGHGDWKMRVERLQPRTFRGCSTHGFLGEHYERLSLAEFADRYGGGAYKVTVMRPVGHGDNATRADYKSVRSISFKIPGDPTLEGIATQSDDDMANKGYQPVMFPGGDPVPVQIERIKMDRDRERILHEERRETQRRLDEERRQNNRMPEHQLSAFYDSTKRAFDDVKDFADAREAYWATEVERFRAENHVLRQDKEKLTEELGRARADVSNTNRQIETQAMREQKERYEERISEIKDRYEEERRRRDEEHGRKLSEMATEHRRVVEEMAARQSQERRDYEAAQALERERAREENRNRVESIERQKQTEIDNMRNTYEARITDILRGKDSELSAVRDQTQREINTVRIAEQASATLTRETSQSRVAMLEQESHRLNAEVARLTDKVEDLRAENQRLVLGSVKDPVTAIRDAQELARFSGMVDGSEAGGAPTWAQTGMKVIEQFAENLPDMIDKVTKNRDAAAEAAARRDPGRVVMTQPGHPQQQRSPLPPGQHPQQRYAPPPMGAMPQQQQHPSQRQPVQGPWNAPEPVQSYAPPPLGAVAFGVDHPVPMSPAVYQVPSPIQPGGQSAASGPTPMGAGADVGASNASVVEESDAGDSVAVGPVTFHPASFAAQPAPQQQQSQQQSAQPLAGVDKAHIVEFMQRLEGAIRERVVSARLFARGFFDRAGPQGAARMLGEVSPEMVFQLASGSSNASAIVTRDGQKYVREMFAEVQRLAQQPPQPQPQPGGM